MESTHEYVFVYGTLRRGEPNSRLLNSSKYITKTQTVDYCLMSGNGIPFVCKKPDDYKGNCAAPVVGEVFKVTRRVLNALDRLEGHPTWYCREKVMTECGVEAWIYFNTDGAMKPIPPNNNGLLEFPSYYTRG